MNNKIDVVAVVGPTASGKTRLSVELAKELNGEIVSADSMQIYKGMDIATAKPLKEEMQGIPHHLMGFLDSDRSFSVAEYVNLAHKAIYEINSKGKLPIIAGGTGLYVDSLLNNIKFENDSSDKKIREKYEEIYQSQGIDSILEILKIIDNDSYNRLIAEKNPKRIIRALEFYEITGKTITEQNLCSRQEPLYSAIKIGLTCRNRAALYDRINSRVDLMLESGLLDEAEKVLSGSLSETAKKAIGYKEIKPYFDGTDTLEHCVDNLKMNTRRYAKRQLTWFRRDKEINWIFIDEYRNFNEILQKALNIIKLKELQNG